MKKLIELLCVILLTQTSCVQDNSFPETDIPRAGYLTKMPEETNVGANSFGCYINKKIVASQGWYQTVGIDSDDRYWIEYSRYVNGWYRYPTFADGMKTYLMSIQAYCESHYIQIFLKNSINMGQNSCTILLELPDSKKLYIDNVVIDVVRFDTTEHIISGRFDSIETYLDNSTIHITKGRFDVKYGTNF